MRNRPDFRARSSRGFWNTNSKKKKTEHLHLIAIQSASAKWKCNKPLHQWETFFRWWEDFRQSRRSTGWIQWLGVNYPSEHTVSSLSGFVEGSLESQPGFRRNKTFLIRFAFCHLVSRAGAFQLTSEFFFFFFFQSLVGVCKIDSTNQLPKFKMAEYLFIYRKQHSKKDNNN